MLLRTQSVIALLTCACFTASASTQSGIGIVVTNGQAFVDGAVVQGNSNLFQGSEIKAGESASNIRFSDGSTLTLQPGAAVKVYRDHSELQQGVATQRASDGRTLVADGLKVSSSTANGSVLVGIKDDSHFEAVAQGAPAEVRTPTGTLVARLDPGKPLSFAIKEMAPGVAEPPSGGGGGGNGQAAPAATGGGFWTVGNIVFIVVVFAVGTVVGLAAAGEFSSGPSHPVSNP
jgi:hypothetical protein